MALELVRAQRSLYDDVAGSPTGQPSRGAVAALPTLLPTPATRQVTLLWSAARGLVFPQIAPESVESASRAIGAARSAFVTRPVPPCPPEITGLLHPPVASGEPQRSQQFALQCLGHALAYLGDPTPARFMLAMDAHVASQHREFADTVNAREAWIGWLDDVSSRSDRFDPLELLELLEHTLRGTLDMLPPHFEWEGAGDEDGRVEAWANDAPTDQPMLCVLSFEEPVLADGALQVAVRDQPVLVRDRLRIEYLFEHFIHRRFMDGYLAGAYERIDYHCARTGDRWSAPA